MINTAKMEVLLMKYFDIRMNIIVPCVSDWSNLTLFEIDLLILSKSKYATAIEIKISKADLKNDLKKKHINQIDKYLYNGKLGFDHYYENIKHFYYAVPEELKEEALDQIPSWSGLLIAKRFGEHNHIVQIRKPKILFKTKWNDEMRFQLARLGTMRILNLKQNLINKTQSF